jgi:formate hydrogenlyase subunit 6/NADH:ubiquinone oxidoreductase subunit I
MLRKIRISLASLFFVGVTLLFLDFTGTLHHWLGWMAKLQFLPAVLALNVVVIALLAVLTLVFGRIYCSVICPLGVMQDVMARLNRRKNKYSYSKAKAVLRYTMLVLMVAAFIAGIGSAVALLDPYGSYGRIASNLLQPLWLWGNNALASLAESADSYTFYSADVWIKSMPTFIIAASTMVVIGALAWKNGRTYCNTICPVGTTLSFLARFSFLKVSFDAEKCRSCSKCSRNCKAACIDYTTHTVDYSRCVVCGNCISNCGFGALKYGRKPLHSSKKQAESSKGAEQAESIDKGKRSFLIASALMATAAVAQEKKKVDGGLAVIEDKVEPARQTPITPPGSLSADNMASRCTGCQLCVAECPNGVLRPSADLMKLMQPSMSFERGYCRPECTRCSELCPTGAIQPITPAEKSATQMGHAVWVKKNCIPLTDGVNCGNCARHCPTGAIEMVPSDENDNSSVKIPVVNEARCIGCGACENLCPARPFSAIYVEGHEVHRSI